MSGDAHHQHIVVVAGHQVATGNVFRLAHRGLKGAQHRRRLALQRDANVDRHALAQQPVVDLGAVAANGSRGLQRLNAPRGRRGRKTHSLAHLVVGGAAMALQVAQNRRIQFVESCCQPPAP